MFPAPTGKDNVTLRKLSVPEVPTMLLRVTADWMTGTDVNTDEVVPPHVYVYAGATPASVQATEHLSIAICRPLVVSVFKSDD